MTTIRKMDNHTNNDNTLNHMNVPVIDIGPLMVEDVDDTICKNIIQQIVDACTNYGFFQIINHNISYNLIDEFRIQLQYYFEDVPLETKQLLCKRSSTNSRGFFDDELTKQKMDWKQCLDVGMPGSRDWNVIPDNDIHNACLDGYNQFPSTDLLPNFRNTVIQYYNECTTLSHLLTILMAQGIDPNYTFPKNDNVQSKHNEEEKEKQARKVDNNNDNDDIVTALCKNHTSYLRMNYYPICDIEHQQLHDEKKDNGNDSNDSNNNEYSILGISPHRDAGFLTILLQDDNCYSLQVLDHKNNDWITIKPIPYALTINTGDMAQIWSNGLYHAPIHRVLTNQYKKRYSAPYFYNPPYNTYIKPMIISNATTVADDIPSSSCSKEVDEENITIITKPKYHPVLWGYFRAVRFAGDFTNLGMEIQIDDFEYNNTNTTLKTNDNEDNDNDYVISHNHHMKKQELFSQITNFLEPFDVEKFRTFIIEQNDSK